MKIIIHLYLILFVLSSCSTASKKNSENSDLNDLKDVSSELSKVYAEYKNKYNSLFLNLRDLPRPEKSDGLTAQLLVRIDEKLGDSQQLIYDHLIPLEMAQKKLTPTSLDPQADNNIEKMNTKLIELIKSEISNLNNYNRDLEAAKKLLFYSVKFAGSYLCFTDLNFENDSSKIVLDHKQSKNAFERMVLYANKCKDFKFEIHNHTSRDNDKADLSLKRALAVKNKLIQSGIKSDKIVGVKGLAANESLIVEPALGSLEEKNMEKTELEYIRSVNNRIEFKVIQACQ